MVALKAAHCEMVEGVLGHLDIYQCSLPPVTMSRQGLWGQLGSMPLVLGAHSSSSPVHTPLIPRLFHVTAVSLYHIFSSTLAF